MANSDVESKPIKAPLPEQERGWGEGVLTEFSQKGETPVKIAPSILAADLGTLFGYGKTDVWWSGGYGGTASALAA